MSDIGIADGSVGMTGIHVTSVVEVVDTGLTDGSVLVVSASDESGLSSVVPSLAKVAEIDRSLAPQPATTIATARSSAAHTVDRLLTRNRHIYW